MTVVLRSINLCKNMRPSGTTLHANDNFPMRESNWRLVHWSSCMVVIISWDSADLRSSDILAVMAIVSITMPRNVILVVGRISFSVLMGALI